MIDTTFQNQLLEKEMKGKLIAAEIINQRDKNRLLREKIKWYMMIVAAIFVVLLLLLLLYALFPSHDCPKQTTPTVQKSTEIDPKKETIPFPSKQEFKTHDGGRVFQKKPKQAPQDSKRSSPKGYVKKSSHKERQDIPKDGVDYVKFDNHVYKRVWKDGYLVQEKELEKTIMESVEKLGEDIPLLAIPKGKETSK